MIAALDVAYNEDHNRAKAAALVFDRWEADAPIGEYVREIEGIQPYVPGQFFRRELPCLTAMLSEVREVFDIVVVDGFVQLGDQPGLGMHLWDTLGKTIAVVGVAKTRFHNAQAVEVLRGGSRMPLFVSAVGMDPQEAAQCVQRMAGEFRIPTLLTRLDRLTKG